MKKEDWFTVWARDGVVPKQHTPHIVHGLTDFIFSIIAWVVMLMFAMFLLSTL